MSSNAAAYEELREHLEQIARPTRPQDLRTLWVVDRTLGLAVTSNGTVDLLLVGRRLLPSSAIVRRHLEFGRWSIEGASVQVDANRLALPGQSHFLSLAALIAVELTRAGLDGPEVLPEAFRNVEPLIELALRRTVLAEEYISGLIGELLCLEVMLDAINSPELSSSVLDMWRGFQGGRDFVIGNYGIEVKSTRGMTSSHKFSGLHQVEPSQGELMHKQRVFLLSIGLSDGGSEGQSLVELVDRILYRLAPVSPNPDVHTPLQLRFISEVASYGGGNSLGYQHASMCREPVYNVRMKATFTPRLYDLSDPSVLLLRREFLESTHVSADDLQFRLDLPDFINQSNPIGNWMQAIAQMVRTALLR